jgi:hypothetical protein
LIAHRVASARKREVLPVESGAVIGTVLIWVNQSQNRRQLP